jgi:hypothetical protein
MKCLCLSPYFYRSVVLTKGSSLLFPGAGMAGRDVLPHPEPGRANGEILWVLQQRLAGKTPKGRSG